MSPYKAGCAHIYHVDSVFALSSHTDCPRVRAPTTATGGAFLKPQPNTGTRVGADRSQCAMVRGRSQRVASCYYPPHLALTTSPTIDSSIPPKFLLGTQAVPKVSAACVCTHAHTRTRYLRVCLGHERFPGTFFVRHRSV